MHIGMLTDYVAVDATFGPALATQTFRRNMELRGHKTTLIGPRPAPHQRQAPPESILFDAITLRAYYGVRVPFPKPEKALWDIPKFDVVHAHSNSLMMHWAPMMRALHGIPCLSTNTFYLPGFVHAVLPESVLEWGPLVGPWARATKMVEESFARVYNAGDGLIVQCQGLIDYWRSIGMLDVPIHVINRPIDVRNFNRPLGRDPFKADFHRGHRLLVVCRHAKEKALDDLLETFTHYVLPKIPEASLTLVGDGPHHESLIEHATRLGVMHRCDFVGERPQRDLPSFYGHADLFVYTSMIETFGQVISEALWMGLPVVAKDDKMGVAHQVKHELNGILIEPGKDEGERFGHTVRTLLSDHAQRRALGEAGAKRQRTTSAPEVVYSQYEAAYASAQEHYAANPSPWVGRRDAECKAWLRKQHTFPWVWKHLVLSALGAVGTKYRPTNDVPFDAAPDNPADEAYAHEPGGSSQVPVNAAPEAPSRAAKPATSNRKATQKKRTSKTAVARNKPTAS